MKKVFVFLFLLILGMGFIQSLDLSNAELNQISCGTFESSKEIFIGQKIPEQVPYKNEMLNLYFGGEIFGYIEIEQSTIKDFGCTESEAKTYSIYIKDYSTLSDFAEAENPLGLFKEKLKSKEIRVEGASFGKKLKWGFTRFGLNFVKMFYKG